jgi:diguanylate cyclase (GGDEF)-like protein
MAPMLERWRLGIRAKLYSVAILSAFSIALLAAASFHFARTTSNAADRLSHAGFEGVESFAQLQSLLEQHRRLVESAPAEVDRKRLEERKHAMIEKSAQLTILINDLNLRTVDTDSTEIEGELAQIMPTLIESAQDVLFYANNFAQDKAIEAAVEYAKIADEFEQLIRNYQIRRMSIAEQAVRSLSESARALIFWVSASAFAALLLIGPFGMSITRDVLSRLWRITNCMSRLAGHELIEEIPSRDDHDEVGDMARAVQVFKDTGVELLERKVQLEQVNIQLDVALNNMTHGLCLFDCDGRLVICNERYIRMYNLSTDVIKPGCTLREMLEHRRQRGSFMNDPTEYDVKLRTAARNGESTNFTVGLEDGRVIEVVNQPTADGGWVATHDEITERKRSEAKIAHLAHHDVLTNLPNRASFNECFETTIVRANKEGEQFALVCLDLDRFKYVNDLFGHSVGDALLCEVATRLKVAVGDAFLARIGGDEFSVIITGSEIPNMTARLVERIVTALGDFILVDGQKLTANASVGVAIYPNDATDGEKLICNADAALYRAKAEGPGSYRFFEPEMDRQLRDRREIQHDLLSALERGEFKLVYQPQALIDGTVIGFEALVRWHHSTRGLISPSAFIPLAEEGGLIIPLDEWILRAACREAASWKSEALLAVNLSPVHFRYGDLPALVHTILLETGLRPSRLELEITESVLIDDFGRAQAILRRLKTLGVRIAMDDFGTGYSSLSYLQSFPFDKIKIDRSFVSDLEINNNNAAIVRAVITLTRSLKLPVLAEGVETEAQRLILSKEGCDQIQGYLIGKPLPIQNYESIVNASQNDKGVQYNNLADGEVARSALHPFKGKSARRAHAR